MNKFELGQIVATRGVAIWATQDPSRSDHLNSMLSRHASGDWGEVCEEDKQANEYALRDGSRLLSAYTVDGTKFWIITEWDRSVTTVLFPDEY